MIEVKNLNAAYCKNIVFENADFRIDDNRNNFIALVGPNGAGKSTLLSLIDGIIPSGLSVSGNVFIDEKSVLEIPSDKNKSHAQKKSRTQISREKIARTVSYLIQNENPAWNLSVTDFVKTGLYTFNELSENQKTEKVKSVLKLLNIEQLSDKKIFNISGGELQKVRLARTLAAENKYLLLDEPSENLDIAFQSEFFGMLKKIGAGTASDTGKETGAGISSDGSGANSTRNIIFSIHDINLAANFADSFLLIADKKIQSLTRDELFTEKVIESAWHKKCRIFEHPVTKKPQVLFLD